MAIIVMMTMDEHYFFDQNDDDVEAVDKFVLMLGVERNFASWQEKPDFP